MLQKKIMLPFVIAMCFLAIGCDQAITPDVGSEGSDTKTYEMGDIYYEDGTPMGIVFYTYDSGSHGLVVSLDEVDDIQWSTETRNIGANSLCDGRYNTDLVCSLESYTGTTTTDATYPVFFWCRLKGNDWYLPSYLELLLLRDSVDYISDQLYAAGGKWIDGMDDYFSSTEIYTAGTYVRYQNMDNHSTLCNEKTDEMGARAIRAF